MNRFLALVLAAFVLAACGPAFVSGSVGGSSIDSSDAIASTHSAFGVGSLSVVIGGDTSDLCADFSKGILHKGASMLELGIIDMNGIRAIEYSVKDSGVSAHAQKLDSACKSVLDEDASGGTITLTKVDGTAIQGSFDLQFGKDELSGSFSATLCSDTSVDEKTCQ